TGSALVQMGPSQLVQQVALIGRAWFYPYHGALQSVGIHQLVIGKGGGKSQPAQLFPSDMATDTVLLEQRQDVLAEGGLVCTDFTQAGEHEQSQGQLGFQ